MFLLPLICFCRCLVRRFSITDKKKGAGRVFKIGVGFAIAFLVSIISVSFLPSTAPQAEQVSDAGKHAPPAAAKTSQESGPSGPKEALAWCEYNDIRNRMYREYTQKDEAAHPRRKLVLAADTERLVKQIERKLRPERERLFGKISDEDFQLIDMRSISGDWYQKYCVAKRPEQEWVPVTNSPWDGSVSQVETWIKKNLNDADSFEAVEWSPVVKMDDGYLVRCKFRAKNAYGAYMLSNAVFKLDRQGNVVDVSGLN